MRDTQDPEENASSSAAAADMAVDPSSITAAMHQQFQQEIAKPAIKKPHQHFISMHSDSNYNAVARFTRRPFAVTAAVPHVLLNSTVFGNTEDGDPDWAADCLSDDDIDTDRPEAAVAPLLEEGELDADAIVVSPTGNSALAANNVAERRRREEGWNDLGLDQIDTLGNGVVATQTRHDTTT